MTAPLDIHSLAGAYALDALDDIERELFDDHIIACETCASEVAELRETASYLAFSVAEAPPPGMRTAVLERVRHTRQAFPAMRQPTRRQPALRWRHRTRTLMAAGLAAVVAAAGVYVVQELRLREQRIEAQAQFASMEAVLAAPDAKLNSDAMPGGGRLTMVMSAGRNEAVVVLSEAAELDPDETYQLWLFEGSTPHSAGLFEPGQTTARRLVTGVSGKNALAITIEPAGGSISPSGSPLVQIPIV